MSIPDRKADHIELCATGDVAFRQGTTLLECVKLVHNALPELHVNDVDLGAELFGKRVNAPILIAAMTGGTAEAGEINRELATIAEERGLAFGLGSQRAMHVRKESVATYRIRDVAPNTLVFGNIGVVQARAMATLDVEELVREVGANALCVHLNPSMELIQSDGDRDFRGGLETIGRLSRELSVPVIVKETGSGLSPSVIERIMRTGVNHVDVSGAGGTSWVGVETKRAERDGNERGRALGEAFWDWGIPTAASVIFASRASLQTVIATGGIQSGLDVARAIALGAHLVGIARPVLRQLRAKGPDGARAFIDEVIEELRTAMLLVGARNLGELRRSPRIILGELQQWSSQVAGTAASR